jgi:hypothetical protein
LVTPHRRHVQLCCDHADRRQALRLRRTASRRWGLTATRMAARWALVPSMTRSVRRRGRASSVEADFRFCQEAKQLAAGCIEAALLGFGLAMGQHRPAVVADELEDDLLDRPPAETAVHLQSADDLTAKDPDVVAVQTQGLARQIPGQHLAQERFETFHDPQAVRNVAWLIRPTGRPDRDPDSSFARDRRRSVVLAGCQASRQLPWVLLSCG